MMPEEEKKLPAGIAGLTSYDVNPEKIRLKPMVVIAVVVSAILLEIVIRFVR